MKRKYMKWKDNELRMQVGLVVTHTDDDLLFMKSEKYANTLDALQAFAELVRQDEREACVSIEQYAMQMAAICTAAIGYWKESDNIHPDCDSLALRDVAKLYAKYAELYTAPPRKEWVGLTVEDIRLMAHNDDKNDWNDLRFRSCWHEGYVDGVNAANAKLKELNK